MLVLEEAKTEAESYQSQLKVLDAEQERLLKDILQVSNRVYSFWEILLRGSFCFPADAQTLNGCGTSA
jgi:hypothetical protein